MGTSSNIQWTDATWNIARGCTKVDEDCKYCYMYRNSLNNTRYNPMQVVRTKTVFSLPIQIKEPSKIFASSLTDVFHPAIDGYRDEMWKIIQQCPHHTFQILTKRPERIIDNLPANWDTGYPNVWIGTSVGSNKSIKRIYDLAKVPAKIRFISFEPLWEDIQVDNEVWFMLFTSIHWAIIGGESGNDQGKYRYRECQLTWIENLKYHCQSAMLKVFIKQLGTHLAKQLNLKDRHGGDINEWPEHLQAREFPLEGPY